MPVFMRLVSLSLFAFTAACANAASKAALDMEGDSAALTVFQNVFVLTMTDQGAVHNAQVIVENGKIISVGASDSPAPAGARVIDATGKYLMPGLADMHVHYFSESEGPLFLANSVTTVRNLWGSAQTFELDAKAKAGAYWGPHIYTSGPLMDGPEPIWGAGAIEITSPEEAAGAVESQRASGYKAIKLYAKLSRESYAAAVGAAKEAKMQVWTHVPAAMSVEDVLDLGVDSIEHLDGYSRSLTPDGYKPPKGRGQSLARWASAEEGKLADLATRTAKAGVWNAPTFAVIAKRYEYAQDTEGYFASDAGAYVGKGLREWWSGSAAGMKELSPRAEAAVVNHRAFVKALYDAGAGLLVGTDTPNPFVTAGFSIHDELNAFVEAGIPVEDVLRIATADAARFLNAEGEFGVIAEDARADLVLLDVDPRTDLNTLRYPAGVMINGRWANRNILAGELAAIRQKLAADAEAPEE